MTRKAMILLLKKIEKDIFVCSLESTFEEDAKSCAIHEAIEVLQTEPCEDCISRQAAIDALIGWETEPLDEDIEMALRTLPSVTPQTEPSKIKCNSDTIKQLRDMVADINCEEIFAHDDVTMPMWTSAWRERMFDLIDELPSVTAERKPAWTPVKTRPLTDEERDGLLIDAECAFDCPMPEDGQEVIVTTDLGGVGIDTFCRDVEGCYFENYDDDVIAWMPLPEPWKEDAE